MVQAINSQQVAAGSAEAAKQGGGWFGAWGFLILILLGILVFIGITAWLLYKFLKKLNEPEKGLMDAKIEKFRSIGSRLRNPNYYRAYFKYGKNAPIKLWWYEDERLMVRVWGHYMGEMTSSDGYTLLNFSNRAHSWLLFFIPKIECIWIPAKGRVEVLESYDMKTNKEKVKTVDIPCNLLSYCDDGIYIHSKSLDEENGVYRPVLLDKEGRPLDFKMVSYSQIEASSIRDFLYQNTNASVEQVRRGFEINTEMMGVKKVHDAGSSAH